METRWKQRFQNFEKAFLQLEKAVTTIKSPSDLEKEGTIQRFEFTHELAWKVMKDFLKDKGIQNIIGSKDATRHAFQNNLIEDGEVWMEMIASRNKTVHTYEVSILFEEYEKIVLSYYEALKHFVNQMKKEL